jgi:hypothetical protein
VLGKSIVNFVVARNRLFLASEGIDVNVVTTAMMMKNTALLL